MKKTIIILSLLLSFICSFGQKRINIVFTTAAAGPAPYVDTIWRTPGKDSIQFLRGFYYTGLRYHAIKDSTGGGATITADNGLTKTSNNVALGGTLTGNTTIAGGIYELSLSSSDLAGNGVFNSTITGSSSGKAIKGDGGTNGTGVWAVTDNGGAGYFVANTGSGLIARSYTGLPFEASSFHTSTNTVIETARIERLTSGGTPANGIGASIDFVTQTSSGNPFASNQLISKFTDAAHLTRTSEFSITGVNNTGTNILLKISGGGIFTLVQGLTDYANNAAALSGGLTAGQLYRNGDAVNIVH